MLRACPKISVLHSMMMSHGGELLARYCRLNQSHHEYVLLADSRLKGYKENVASFTGLKLQVSTLKKQVSGLNDKLATSDASFAKSKAKGKERKKKIKSLTKIASVGFERGLSMHRTKNEFAVVLKKIVNFMLGAHDMLAEASPLLLKLTMLFLTRDTRVSSPIAKELTMTLVSESLELSANVNFTASAADSEHDKEMINAEVDGSNPKMTDDTTAFKSGRAFVQGISVALDDVTELVEVGGGARGMPGTLVSPSLGKTDCRCVVVHPADPESYHPP
uniref:Uncharacterized protein n=1 Tax=Tanacetum cinerariifolium TaxID=118510 RepID=A0A6L2N5I9_TANCI|nr:hypothetical protein [Tanacetum cinerariifolium]